MNKDVWLLGSFPACFRIWSLYYRILKQYPLYKKCSFKKCLTIISLKTGITAYFDISWHIVRINKSHKLISRWVSCLLYLIYWKCSNTDERTDRQTELLYHYRALHSCAMLMCDNHPVTSKSFSDKILHLQLWTVWKIWNDATAVATRRSQLIQECINPRRYCFCAS